jgi:hypothetical protein
MAEIWSRGPQLQDSQNAFVPSHESLLSLFTDGNAAIQYLLSHGVLNLLTACGLCGSSLTLDETSQRYKNLDVVKDTQ